LNRRTLPQIPDDNCEVAWLAVTWRCRNNSSRLRRRICVNQQNQQILPRAKILKPPALIQKLTAESGSRKACGSAALRLRGEIVFAAAAAPAPT
jgi:hypothetical protein